MQSAEFKDPIKDFPLILLAGGRSSRMGTPKGLLDYQGHPWLVEQLRRFKAASGKRAIIVLGFHQAPYFEQIPWLEKAVQQPGEATRAGNFSCHQSTPGTGPVLFPSVGHYIFAKNESSISAERRTSPRRRRTPNVFSD